MVNTHKRFLLLSALFVAFSVSAAQSEGKALPPVKPTITGSAVEFVKNMYLVAARAVGSVDQLACNMVDALRAKVVTKEPSILNTDNKKRLAAALITVATVLAVRKLWQTYGPASEEIKEPACVIVTKQSKYPSTSPCCNV